MLSRKHTPSALLAAVVACAAWFGTAPLASASTASETVSAGSLAFINGTPGNVSFPGVTLDGTDQVKTQAQAIDVSDATGSSSGWAITATSTQFTAGTHTLGTGATTIPTAPTRVCDASSSCTLATNSVPYPYFLPAGPTAPTATKLYNAAANTGMGAQTLSTNWQLSVPASTWAGGAGTPYSSTWTFTLVSGP